jgi:hypothetical protein
MQDLPDEPGPPVVIMDGPQENEDQRIICVLLAAQKGVMAPKNHGPYRTHGKS